MSEALYILEKEGYPVYSGRFEQINNPGKMTTQKVLCPPGTKHSEIYDLEKIHTIMDYQTNDGGTNVTKFQYPASLDPKRLKVLLGDEMGLGKTLQIIGCQGVGQVIHLRNQSIFSFHNRK